MLKKRHANFIKNIPTDILDLYFETDFFETVLSKFLTVNPINVLPSFSFRHVGENNQ